MSLKTLQGYYLRLTENGKRKMLPAGDDFQAALTALRNKEVAREYVKHGLDKPTTTGSERLTIADAVAQFIKNQSALDKAGYTVYVYTRAAEQFRDSCRRVHMDEIDRQAIIDYIQYYARTSQPESTASVMAPYAHGCNT